MDQAALVASGQALVKELDKTGYAPRLAMWVHSTDFDTWKLWLVPPVGKSDKADFYRRIAQIISSNRNTFGGLDVGDTEMILDSHRAINGLKRFMRMPGLGSVHVAGSTLNGFYLPEGIILRSAL